MTASQTPRVTVPAVLSSKQLTPQKKLVAITAYDYTMARLVDAACVDIVLVGDSLGAVVQGMETTLPVTLDEIIYHTRCVMRGVQHALVVADLPFMSYQVSAEMALESAGRILKEAGASAVKLEGGTAVAHTIERLVSVDIPVMGHVGLTPQSYHRMGGHKVQGRASSAEHKAGSRERVLEDALAVQSAGAFACVLESIPSDLAAEITGALEIPTIGIGAGVECDGQILVSTDVLGLNPEFNPKFVKRYAELGRAVIAAVENYAAEVRSGEFPDQQHSFSPEPKTKSSRAGLKLAR